ncbi:MAG: nucleotide exchange factor GrpE [Chthoniobacterales bacterium]
MPRKREITLPDEFASTMQQLVAEAEKTIPARTAGEDSEVGDLSKEMHSLFETLNGRMAGLEQTISDALGKLASPDHDLASQLQRMDEHFEALRNTENVNQRLFNSLHQELKSYRDNFLRESLQKPFIRDLVVLFDDLSSLSAQMQSARGGADNRQGQWCDNLENAIHSLVEVLHRMEVNEIEPKEKVDRVFHRVVSYEPADFPEDDGRIVMRVKRGFLWRDHVLRPEEVVAKRFG